jgi:S1-C subfamily serine protease
MNKGGDLSALDNKGGDTIVKVLVYSKRYDLCLMTSRQDLPALKLAKSYELYDNAHVLGHPLGLSLTHTKGRLTSKEIIKLPISCKEFYDEKIKLNVMYKILFGIEYICLKYHNSVRIHAPIYPGNSGSPVLNVWGNINGVVFAGSNDAEFASYIVPLEDVTRFITSIRVK